MAFRRLKSFKDYLIRAKLRPLDREIEGTRGTYKFNVLVADVMFVIILLWEIGSLAMLLVLAIL